MAVQRFCSHACRHALERVQQRERRWKCCSGQGKKAVSSVDFRIDDSSFAARAEPFRLGGEVPLAQVAIKAAYQKGQGARELE